jgi:hypothetical protein
MIHIATGPSPNTHESYFTHNKDPDNLIYDAMQSLSAVMALLAVDGFDVHKQLSNVTREDLASLLKLIGLQMECARQSYFAEREFQRKAANQN